MHRQKPGMCRERLRQRRNGHRQDRHEKNVVKGSPDARTGCRRQRVIVDMVNTSIGGTTNVC
uniref:Uncharacterized protein n=1 Tax=Cucumis melo TaxID=3656 RepID=A0A9I9DT49_CUCME